MRTWIDQKLYRLGFRLIDWGFSVVRSDDILVVGYKKFLEACHAVMDKGYKMADVKFHLEIKGVDIEVRNEKTPIYPTHTKEAT